MNLEKENFLRSRFIRLLQQIDPNTPPAWGKMSFQQMVEHFTSDGLEIANGKRKFEIVTPPERLAAYRDFLASDRPFKENTRNPLLQDEPPPTEFHTIQAAIGALQEELIHFFMVFAEDPLRTTRNPIFGDLNFEQNVQLLHKHAMHHLRQFGVII